MSTIIGIVGPFACGKGVVTDYLIKKYGYTSFSLSSIVHEEVKKRGIKSYDRTILQNIGDELRKKEGEGVLARRAIEQLIVNSQQLTAESLKLKAKKNQLRTTYYELRTKIIIEGIRNPGEIHYLRSIPGFFLIAVDANQKLRFQRMLARKKPWDPIDWESFKKVDGRDRGDAKNKSGQQVKKCMEMADITIVNNKEREDIYKAIEEKLFIVPYV